MVLLMHFQLDENEMIIQELEAQIQTLENKLRALEQLQSLQSSIHSQKWEEFSRLAESMKTLSHTMIQATTSQKPWIKSADHHDYSWGNVDYKTFEPNSLQAVR